MRRIAVVAPCCAALVLLSASNAAVIGPRPTSAPRIQRRWLSSSLVQFIGYPEASVTTSARGRVTLSDGDVIMGISFPEDGTLVPVSTTGKDGSLVPASTTLVSGNPLITETDDTSGLASNTASSPSSSIPIPISSSASTAATSDGSYDGISLQLASVYATVLALVGACLVL